MREVVEIKEVGEQMSDHMYRQIRRGVNWQVLKGIYDHIFVQVSRQVYVQVKRQVYENQIT